MGVENFADFSENLYTPIPRIKKDPPLTLSKEDRCEFSHFAAIMRNLQYFPLCDAVELSFSPRNDRVKAKLLPRSDCVTRCTIFSTRQRDHYALFVTALTIQHHHEMKIPVKMMWCMKRNILMNSTKISSASGILGKNLSA